MQEPMVPSNRSIQPGLQSPLATPSAHQVIVLQSVVLQQSRADTHHGTHVLRNIKIRGTVNDTTAHAQNHDVRVTSVLSCIKILVVWVMRYGSGMFGGRD